MKIYKTGGWKSLIEEVEVEKVSEKSVWLKNGRSARRSNYANYWDTIDEAKKHLKGKIEIEIKGLNSRLSKLENSLKELDNY